MHGRKHDMEVIGRVPGRLAAILRRDEAAVAARQEPLTVVSNRDRDFLFSSVASVPVAANVCTFATSLKPSKSFSTERILSAFMLRLRFGWTLSTPSLPGGARHDLASGPEPRGLRD